MYNVQIIIYKCKIYVYILYTYIINGVGDNGFPGHDKTR